MLQYEETTGAWSEIGKMKKARSRHAVVAVVDVSLFCYGIVGQINIDRLYINSPRSSCGALSSTLLCNISLLSG